MKERLNNLYKNKLFNYIITILAVVFLPLIYQCLAQFLIKTSFVLTVEYLWIYKKTLLLGTVFLVLVMAAITVLTSRVVIANIIVGLSIFALSVAHYFKLYFREEVLMPSDLTLVKEAGMIAGELNLFITREIIVYLIFFLLATVILFKIRIPKTKFRFEIIVRVVLAAVFVFTTVFYTKTVLYNEPYMEKMGLGGLENEQIYYKGTFVTSFLYFTRNAFYSEPEGFDNRIVEKLYSDMQKDKTTQARPDILVVMLEGYFHPDYYDKEIYSENLTENYDRIAKEGLYGNHIAATFGGGTADIEFEALSGYSKSLLPDVGTAYNNIVKDGFNSYVSYLKNNNYKTIALHSFVGTLYNRVTAYKNMGFDRYYTQDDFNNPEMVGQYISDMATMDKIIRLYENEVKSGAENVFIHTVTMQNHAPIEKRFSREDRIKVESDRLSDEDKYTLGNFVTCQQLTDEAIGYLVDYFRTSEREVVILFFGDHQMKASSENDADPLVRTDFYTRYSGAEQNLNLHKVPFLMWSNYRQKEGMDLGTISTELLLPNMLVEYDVVRPDYFDYLYDTQDTIKGYIPAVDLVVNPDNSISYGLTDKQKEQRTERRYIQYDAILGDKIIEEYYYN